jgi:hypothetical protein
LNSKNLFLGEKPVKKKKAIYFEPTDMIVWLVGNQKYDKVREAGIPY